MIFDPPPTTSGAVPQSVVAAERAEGLRSYTVEGAAAPIPIHLDLQGDFGDATEIKPVVNDVVETFDWSPRSQREFIALEQKILAKEATKDEESRYQSMKRSRDSQIFAEKYLRDYREIQRLKILSEKLLEIQQYLRPIGAK